METVFILFKIDLSITHKKKDEYLKAYLLAQQSDIENKGIQLDLTQVEDQILLSDYASWNYRKRTEDVSLPKNLHMRIRNKIVGGRALLE